MLLYQRKEEIVEATRMTRQVDMPLGTAKPGDWLVITADGLIRFFTEAEFFAHYEPCDDESAQPTRFRAQRKARIRSKKNGLDEVDDQTVLDGRSS